MTFAQMRRTCCSTNNAKHLLPSHKTARQVQVKGPLRISLTQKLSFFLHCLSLMVDIVQILHFGDNRRLIIINRR